MALTYADLAGGILAQTSLYASKMNELREAIDRRATVAGAAVTLPNSVTALAPFAAQFEDWFLAARQCVEDIVAEGFFLQYETHAFTAWSLAELLGYVHATWVTSSFITDGADWAPYDAGQMDPDFRLYVNEIYYACECLCLRDPGVTEKSKAREIRSGAGGVGWTEKPWGGSGVNPLSSPGSVTQSGTFTAGTPLKPGSVQVSGGVGTYFSIKDDGVGGWLDNSGGGGAEISSGSIDYDTGVWTVTFTTAIGAGTDDRYSGYYYGGTPTATEALSLAWAAFEAAGYGASSAGWQAKGHLHLYQTDGAWFAVVESYKVTDGQVTVPDLDYPDIELYLPTQLTYMPYSPAPTLTVGSLVDQVEVSANHYRGWLKVVGDFDDEDVQVGPYFFDIASGNFHFIGPPPYDEACLFEAAPTGVYGRCGFDGYCNGEYAPI